MTVAAVALWLGVPYFLHLGSVLGYVFIATMGASILGSIVIAPFALFALFKWLIEESNWEMYVDKHWHAPRFRRPNKKNRRQIHD